MSDDSLSIAVTNVVNAANKHRGREPDEEFRDALNGLASLDGPDMEQISSRVASALTDITSPSGAGFIAIWLGAVAESGVDPFPRVQPLLDCFFRFTRQIETEDENLAEDEIDDELAVGLDFMGQGLVAHISRDQQSLQALRANDEAVAELERVELYSSGPGWILELIRKVSGTLIVLHGEQSMGVRVEYRNLSNCFHLFTLLQAALAKIMPGARKVDAGVVAVARGERLDECWDEAWWHYGRPVSGEPDLMTSVFGEQNPLEIDSIDGQQILLLWPPIIGSRTWDASFFGPALHAAPAEINLIEILQHEDITKWQNRIGLPSAQAAIKKPWWKFW